VTHWSSRLLADQLGISHSTVARVWAEHDVKPWQTEAFRFSSDPELEARVRDVVGLYLEPSAHAIVLCVDEKSQIQALGRPLGGMLGWRPRWLCRRHTWTGWACRKVAKSLPCRSQCQRLRLARSASR